MSKQTLVYVKPIVRKKWHGLNELGRSKFQDTSDVLMALYDNKIGSRVGNRKNNSKRGIIYGKSGYRYSPLFL